MFYIDTHGYVTHPAPCPPRARRCSHRRERVVGARASAPVTDPVRCGIGQTPHLLARPLLSLAARGSVKGAARGGCVPARCQLSQRQTPYPRRMNGALPYSSEMAARLFVLSRRMALPLQFLPANVHAAVHAGPPPRRMDRRRRRIPATLPFRRGTPRGRRLRRLNTRPGATSRTRYGTTRAVMASARRRRRTTTVRLERPALFWRLCRTTTVRLHSR